MTLLRSHHITRAALLATVALCGLGYEVVIASGVDGAVSPKQADKAERKAHQALAKHDYARAIAEGEKALRGDQRNAGFRMLLGQANLSAGRFTSAETLFADVLTLDPNNGRAALNLALAHTALGRTGEARATLDAHRDQIAAADYGLALALAGDVANAIPVLENAVRAPEATAKARQNLAFVYAMAGRWDEAKLTASQDVPPEVLEKRLGDWASLAHPRASWDQVSALLHVTPANDPGLPMALALNTPAASSAVALAETHPAPVAPLPVASAEAPVPAAEPARFETSPAPAVGALTPAPKPAPMSKHAPVVAAVRRTPARLIRAAAQPAKRFIAEHAHPKAVRVARVHPRAAAPIMAADAAHSGPYVVQLGAFASTALAKSVWMHDIQRVAALRGHQPGQSMMHVRHTNYVRLAALGFKSRAAAGQMCSTLRAAGQACFIRMAGGDQLAAWAGGHHHALAVHKASAAPAVASAKPKTGAAATSAKPKPAAVATLKPKPAAKPAPKPQTPGGSQVAARR